MRLTMSMKTAWKLCALIDRTIQENKRNIEVWKEREDDLYAEDIRQAEEDIRILSDTLDALEEAE